MCRVGGEIIREELKGQVGDRLREVGVGDRAIGYILVEKKSGVVLEQCIAFP